MKLYDVSLGIVKRMGKVNKGSISDRFIAASIEGASVTIKLKQVSSKTVNITISARKFMFPRQEMAGGILYQISEQLK